MRLTYFERTLMIRAHRRTANFLKRYAKEHGVSRVHLITRFAEQLGMPRDSKDGRLPRKVLESM